MNVVVAGGAGLVGRALAARLTSQGHGVRVLTRDPARASALGLPGVRVVAWDPDGGSGPWAAEIEDADAVVNLAGAGIADKRWTAARKDLLRTSRVLPTRSLVTAVRESAHRPAIFVQGSAVGYYGIQRTRHELDESFPPGEDFLGELCVTWEAESYPVTALGCRLVIARSGVVLSADGGMLSRMGLPFKLFMGGPVASGEQYISWIHVDDLVAMIAWMLANDAVAGAVNNTSPEPVTNRVFSGALARALRRPSWVPVPAVGLRVLYGELADTMLANGQRVVPRRACELGFKFEFPSIDAAMRRAIRR
jgi:uncharacterized protein (TIGR01777 family)